MLEEVTTVTDMSKNQVNVNQRSSPCGLADRYYVFRSFSLVDVHFFAISIHTY